MKKSYTGNYHKANGPVYRTRWYLFRKRHRYYGPASWPKYWWIHGDRLK